MLTPRAASYREFASAERHVLGESGRAPGLDPHGGPSRNLIAVQALRCDVVESENQPERSGAAPVAVAAAARGWRES